MVGKGLSINKMVNRLSLAFTLIAPSLLLLAVEPSAEGYPWSVMEYGYIRDLETLSKVSKIPVLNSNGMSPNIIVSYQDQYHGIQTIRIAHLYTEKTGSSYYCEYYNPKKTEGVATGLALESRVIFNSKDFEELLDRLPSAYRLPPKNGTISIHPGTVVVWWNYGLGTICYFIKTTPLPDWTLAKDPMYKWLHRFETLILKSKSNK